MRKAFYQDLSEQYENSIEHSCNMEEGQIFIAEGCVLAHGRACWRL